MKHVWAICASSLLFALGLGGCGYRPVYGGDDPSGRLAVVAAPSRVPDPGAVQAALRGARTELSRAGVLQPGEGYPRLVVELLRVDEIGTGIKVPGEQPLARGAAVAVVGRAWVEDSVGGEPSRDTGDVRRSERVTYAPGPSGDALLHAEAVRSASVALGRALAARALGEPVPADQGL